MQANIQELSKQMSKKCYKWEKLARRLFQFFRSAG